MDEEKCFQINKDYLPIKAHYFFLFGAMGGTLPYMTVFAKSLGIHATAVGIIFTVLPFCIFLTKPIFGYITDYFRNIKLIMFVLVAITSTSFLSALLIPSIEPSTTYREKVHVQCFNMTNNLYVTLISSFNPCMDRSPISGIKSKLLLSKCSNSSLDSTLTGTMMAVNQDTLNLTEMVWEQDLRYSKVNKTYIFETDQMLNTSTCDCILNNDPSFFCDISTLPSVYRSFTFWMFALVLIIADCGAATVFCLSEAVCYEILGENSVLYGRQRVWATIAWGLITSLSGYLNDIATGNSVQKNYSSGFYLMVAFVAVDLFILWRTRLFKAKISTNILGDLSKIFSSYDTIIFSVAVYIAGAMMGLIWNYQFWFLQDLGASQTLLGLSIAVQCLISELPFFFFSGNIITYLGYFTCLTVSFTSFSLLTGLYSTLKDPWFALLVDIFYGPAYALFYATMNTYASAHSAPGTEATTLGVLGGIFDGLGVATGSLLGGVGFDTLGGRQTFFTASMISIVCAPCFAVAHFAFKVLRFKEKATVNPP